MIIDYKTELIHEHTAIACVSEFLLDACMILETKDKKEELEGFDLPIGVILQCIANSHKLDFIRLAKQDGSKQQRIINLLKTILEPRHTRAVTLYQSASKKKIIDKLKPHQYIHKYLSDNTSTTQQQSKMAQKTVKDLDEAFSLSKQNLTLKTGQRLYRGVSITEAELQEFFDAADSGTPLTHKNYMSTSLSESIAKAFSALSYLGKLRENPDDASTLTALVIELTNRRNDLEFILPDALKLVNHNQGQMEVLLPRDIKILPTHFEIDEFNAKIYADIV
ncbi:hypothetical protein LBY39_002081 [Vibrio parahaemolyticus]|nr:hypothetical protein [Vibrio parahaemolyticus]